MKTNHLRRFKETKDPNAIFSTYFVFGASRVLALSDRSVRACTTCGDHTNGKRGIAKDRRGAKKYINSRARFHENMALQKIVMQGQEPE